MQPKFAPLYTYPNLPSPSSIIVFCLNVRGLSSNHQYLELLLNDNNIQKIQELHSDYRFLAACLPCQEHPLFCTPQLLSGHGGVAIGWNCSNSQLDHLIKTDSHCILPPNVRNWLSPAPVFVFSVYLPSRSGCTDVFRESLDQLDAILG